MKWEKVKLGDIISTLKGFAFKSSLYSEGGIPIVRASNFTESSIDSCDLKYYSIENAVEYKKYELKKDDILVQTVGSWESNPNSVVGKVVCVPQNLDGALLNQNIVKIIPNQNINNRWLFFRLKCDDFKNHNIGSAVGAANQASITLNTIRDFGLEIPPVEIQHKIASILSAYDDLIENNKKQIKLLEEAAQRLYKEWFVDLRFPGHENVPVVDGVPEGWITVPFGEILSYEIGGGWGEDNRDASHEVGAFVIRGTDIDKIKKGNFSDVPHRWHSTSNFQSRRLQHNDIIFEVSGGSKSIGVAKALIIDQCLLDHLGDNVICASFCKLIRCKKVEIAPYVYDTLQYWRKSGITCEYEKKSASSIVNYRWKDFLNQQHILTPTDELLNKYKALVVSMGNLINQKTLAISKLTNGRDWLLPKLMSGELEV